MSSSTAKVFGPALISPVSNPFGSIVGGANKPPSYSSLLLWAPDKINDDGDEVIDKTGHARSLQTAKSYLFASGDYISASHLDGTETVTSQGGSATITISSGKIECAAGDILYDLVLSDGTRYACAEGAGTWCFDSSGNGNHGTIVASDISTFHRTGYAGSDVANRHGYNSRLNLEVAMDFTVTASTPDPTFRVSGSDFILNGEFMEGLESSQQIYKPATDFEIGVFNPENVTYLDAHGQYFAGNLPDISNFTALQFLYFSTNELTGSIPDLSNNTALLYLLVDNNNLTGSIPDLSNNTALQYVWMYSNSLIGSIPDLSNNIALLYFYCYDNNLTGSIPDLSNNTVLVHFLCNDNNLTGSIPDLSNTIVLRTFNCNDNSLTGYVGASVGNKLKTVDASNNALSQTAVDAILVQLDDAGATSGTVNLSGGTNAVPSSTGQAAKTSLESKSWTVTVNS